VSIKDDLKYHVSTDKLKEILMVLLVPTRGRPVIVSNVSHCYREKCVKVKQ